MGEVGQLGLDASGNDLVALDPNSHAAIHARAVAKAQLEAQEAHRALMAQQEASQQQAILDQTNDMAIEGDLIEENDQEEKKKKKQKKQKKKKEEKEEEANLTRILSQMIKIICKNSSV